jgi:hypothetical protein
VRCDVVPGDAREHRAEAVALLERNLGAADAAARYAKYYERSPHGPPLFCLARDPSSGAFIGLAAMFPAPLWVAGEPVRSLLVTDLVVDAAHRRGGAAVAMQHHLLERVDAALLYALPNATADRVAPHVEGWKPVGPLCRDVKLLRAAPVIERRIRSATLARVAAVPADAALRLRRRERRSHPYALERPAAFDERFARVFETVRRGHPIAAVRTAEILDWKYGDVPGTSILALTDGAGEVAAYAVRSGGEVLDLAAVPEAREALLAELVLDARASGEAALEVQHLGAAGEALRAFGFSRRAAERRIWAHVRPGVQLRVDAHDPGRWHFLPGDVDV